MNLGLLRTRSLAGLLCLALLAGCGSSPDRPASIAVATYRGLPPGVTPPAGPTLPTVVAVIQPDGRLALTLWGSGSCPTAPVAAEVVDRHQVRVTLSNRYTGACTADFSPTTSVLQLDADRVDTTTDLTVSLIGIPGLPPATAHPLQP